MSTTNFPNAELQIRPASFSDITSIQQIAYDTWPKTYGSILSPEQLQYMLDRFYSSDSLKQQLQDHHHFLLALKNFKPVGFASFSNEEGTTFKLQKLYVLPGSQKTGTGKQLLDTVKTICRSMGGTLLKLNVNRNNMALQFYEQNGFRITSSEDIPIGNGYFMNDYVMAVSLNPGS